jgi:hypothetical protein
VHSNASRCNPQQEGRKDKRVAKIVLVQKEREINIDIACGMAQDVERSTSEDSQKKCQELSTRGGMS